MTNEEHHNQETMKEFSNNSIFGKLTVNDHVPYLLLNGHSTSIFQPIQKKANNNLLSSFTLLLYEGIFQ